MITLFNPENKGLSYSRNLGLSKANGEIIAFIDDDAVPYPYWAKSIIETFETDDNIGAATGDIVPLWENESMSWFPYELRWMISCSYVMTPSSKQEVERGFGTNMVFRKIVFEKMGVFDTNFGINGKKWVGGEDTDMFLRVKKLGMQVIFNPDIRIHHKIYSHRIYLKNIMKRAYNGGYSVALMKKRVNYELSDSTENKYLGKLCKYGLKSLFGTFSLKPLIPFKQFIYVSSVLTFEFVGFSVGYFEK